MSQEKLAEKENILQEKISLLEESEKEKGDLNVQFNS